MRIVSIFDSDLYSFQYNENDQNELARLLDLWNDTEYLYGFLRKNRSDLPTGKSIVNIAKEIIDWTNEIEDLLYEISKDPNARFEHFFKPLHNHEIHEVTLSKQKGRKQLLRLYAIKIDENCFLITGGAIKLTHLMEDRNHTQEELNKIERCISYLSENGVSDSGSFFEFITEQP